MTRYNEKSITRGRDTGCSEYEYRERYDDRGFIIVTFDEERIDQMEIEIAFLIREKEYVPVGGLAVRVEPPRGAYLIQAMMKKDKGG